MTKDSKQKTAEYCMYMMLSGYFKKAECITPLQEKKLYLYYKDLTEPKQVKLEEQCDKWIRNVLRFRVPKALWKEKVQVRLIGREQTGRTKLQFLGEPYALTVEVFEEDGKLSFEHSLFKKEAVA